MMVKDGVQLDYQILKSYREYELSELVSRYLEKGFVTAGGLQVTKDFHGIVYYQAVVKQEA